MRKQFLDCKSYNESMLRCPICKSGLERESGHLTCENHHSFDVAKAGYINLSRKQKASGDNKEMVQARTRFLEKGYYAFLKEELETLTLELQPETLVDLGCGQGYYTKDLGRNAAQSYGIDLSKDAVAYGAKHDKKTQYIVGSIFDLPFEDESADVMFSIFTPVPLEEAHRVLKPDGKLILVGPGVHHHEELKSVLYEKVRLNDPMPAKREGFELVSEKEIRQIEHVENPEDLLEMTPYRYRTPREGLEALHNLQDGLDTTFDFVIQEWRKI